MMMVAKSGSGLASGISLFCITEYECQIIWKLALILIFDECLVATHLLSPFAGFSFKLLNDLRWDSKSRWHMFVHFVNGMPSELHSTISVCAWESG